MFELTVFNSKKEVVPDFIKNSPDPKLSPWKKISNRFLV